ncbi:MAG: c-type cytochrome [Flavobacteriales bacterium]|nr:c-type cytochrome [Flavobacteriales bacterium]
MTKVKNHRNSLTGHIVLSVIFSFIFALSTFAQSGDTKNGKKLFNTNCAACHKLEQRLIGPPLKGVASKRDQKWLQDWIRNSAALIESGDADAKAIFEEYSSIPMTPFPNLSDQDIADIMAYTDADPALFEKKKVEEVAIVVADPIDYTTEVLIAVIVIALFFTIILFRLKSTLLHLYKREQGSYFSELVAYISFIVKNNTLAILFVFLISMLGIYAFWEWGLGVGVDKGYQPIQPIAFSHKVHSGDQEIDCQYCHSSARTSKTSGIPSANVCMNCHMLIQEGENTGKEEIAKIYDAIGFDPSTNSYIENYEQKPIKWVRIHNLPDFVYYNHSQHVTVGGLECQDCHGPVEEMEEVYQYSPLTMSWCIDCHKTEEIKMAGNAYYDKIHKQLAAKYGTQKLTVSMMGGLECGKCHY